MTGQVRTYDPSQVTVVVGGIPISGFADGTFIMVEPMSDASTSQSGADSEIARAMGTDRRHTVTITLQQTSASNDALSALYAVDQGTRGGGLAPLTVVDLSGRTVFRVSQSWVARTPNMEFGKELSDRVWVFHTGAPSVLLVGGNA